MKAMFSDVILSDLSSSIFYDSILGVKIDFFVKNSKKS